jgi:competence protein ComFC
MVGYFVYNILSQNSFLKFAKEFNYPQKVYALAVDDRVDHGYSHTAILANALRTETIKPLYKGLRAKNRVSYSTKSLDFRLKNPRDFQLNIGEKKEIILVDDIITTGATISEAFTLLQEHSHNTLFALTLADAAL